MRRPAAEEGELWRRAMRDVAPLPGRRQSVNSNQDRGHPARPPSGAGETPAAPTEAPAPAPPPPPQLPPLDRQAGIDRATAERLRRGRYPIEATLDLHGLTQEEAHRALSGFVAASRHLGRRGVIVVTGHGRTSGGILKAAVPRWLDEPHLRRHVLMIAPARPQHGGHGALYVLLRRASR
jgi:DNA-nicking Smr family endonuclease